MLRKTLLIIITLLINTIIFQAYAAFPTAVNGQITDSVTQTNTKVIGQAPAMAVGNIYQTLGTSQAELNLENSYNQQQSDIISTNDITTDADEIENMDIPMMPEIPGM